MLEVELCKEDPEEFWKLDSKLLEGRCNMRLLVYDQKRLGEIPTVPNFLILIKKESTYLHYGFNWKHQAKHKRMT